MHSFVQSEIMALVPGTDGQWPDRKLTRQLALPSGSSRGWWSCQAKPEAGSYLGAGEFELVKSGQELQNGQHQEGQVNRRTWCRDGVTVRG